MPETTRRVSVTLTFATNDPMAAVLSDILGALHDGDIPDVETATVHAFDLNEDGPDEPAVHLVVDPIAGITGAWIDNEERADEFARNTGGVVVGLPAATDYRDSE
jgi:hypothetical protein